MGNEAEVFRGLGRVPKVCRYMSGQRIYLFIIFFFSLHGYVSYPRRIGAVSVYDTYRTRDTWPERRVCTQSAEAPLVYQLQCTNMAYRITTAFLATKSHFS